MKISIWLLLFLCYNSVSYAQEAQWYYEINNQRAEEKAGYKNTKPLVFFDAKNQPIKKSVFEKQLRTRRFFQIPGDSLHHRKLIPREFHGKTLFPEQFRRLLETDLSITLDPKKPIVIVYYPGKNKCNASGSATKKSMQDWHKQMEAGMLGKTNDVLYLHRKGESLPKKYSWLNFREDPQGIAEQLFFQYNFPCNSFVVISKTGRYVAFYGEFGKPMVWKTVDFILEE
jgi:hypothetical protein